MLKNADYQLELRRFISSQHLYTGIRVTAGVIIPALILYHFGLLASMTSIPLGASFIGLIDSPGPPQHRRNGMLIGIALNFIMVLIPGLSAFSPLLIGAEIIVFGVFFSLIAIYGARAGSIGLTALIVFILNIDSSFGSDNILHRALYYSVGGAWYALLSMSLTGLRPYKPIQQLLGECLMKTADYLVAKSRMYVNLPEDPSLFNELIEIQVRIHQYQEQLREMLFNTRRFISESTHKGRILMMSFRDSVDLFERIMTSQQDYALLHKAFDDSGILEVYRRNILAQAAALRSIGLSLQEGLTYRKGFQLTDALRESGEAFKKLREAKMTAANIEGFIRLRHILNSLQDITERIKRIQTYTSYDKEIARQFNDDTDFSRFAVHQEINVDLLKSNLSWRSGSFRHAIRLTIALLAGYFISLFFDVGHGYWILLTIATIIKPAYGLTKQRNIQRLAGTFIGAALAFLILYLDYSNTLVFIVMTTAMIVSYALIRINYGVSIAALTVFLLLAFHFAKIQGLNIVLQDRIVDTVIGSVIAYIVSYFVLPAWEYEQLESSMRASINANRNYFLTVAQAFTGNPADTTSFKMARKEAFVALANLSDNFQRMLSDPKNQQPNLRLYHQFVSASHMLTSHIAALSSYAQQYASAYAQPDFQPLINTIDKILSSVNAQDGEQDGKDGLEINNAPLFKKVSRLLEQRKKDLEQGLENTPAETRKALSELSTIADQFRLIHSISANTVKIFLQSKASQTA